MLLSLCTYCILLVCNNASSSNLLLTLLDHVNMHAAQSAARVVLESNCVLSVLTTDDVAMSGIKASSSNTAGFLKTCEGD